MRLFLRDGVTRVLDEDHLAADANARRHAGSDAFRLIRGCDAVIGSAEHDGRHLQGGSIVEDPGAGQHADSLRVAGKPHGGHRGFDLGGDIGFALGLMHESRRPRSGEILRAQTHKVVDPGPDVVRQRRPTGVR